LPRGTEDNHQNLAAGNSPKIEPEKFPNMANKYVLKVCNKNHKRAHFIQGVAGKFPE
jgi:hypothetical protein